MVQVPRDEGECSEWDGAENPRWLILKWTGGWCDRYLCTFSYIVLLLITMSGCLHPRAPATYPDRHRLRRRIWNIEGKTGFINPKNQVHKNVINWKIFGFQVIIFCCSFFLREINVPVSLHQHLSIARAGGRSWISVLTTTYPITDKWPHGKRSLWCWCWITFCLYFK